MPISFYPLGEPWFAPAVTEGLRRAKESKTPFTAIGRLLDELEAERGLGKEDLLHIHDAIIRQLRATSPQNWRSVGE